MILVLLPAYNEEKSLPALLPKLKSVLDNVEGGYRIVVCNDGSRDQTGELLAEYARKMPIEILHHKINRGLGETIRDLFEYAAAHTRAADIVVRLDCDDTHEPEVIPRMVEKIRSGCDVVIASRFEPGGGQQGLDAYRTLISRAANVFMKIFFPIKGLKEYSCGFRAYRAEIIQQAVSFYGNNFIQLKGLGFTCTLEKLIKLDLLGAKFGEVPFELRYDQKVSESKMVSSVTTLGYLVMTLLHHWPWGGWRRAYQLKKNALAAKLADTNN
jgi:dolichol-phosphate mannosyltransferase